MVAASTADTGAGRGPPSPGAVRRTLPDAVRAGARSNVVHSPGLQHGLRSLLMGVMGMMGVMGVMGVLLDGGGGVARRHGGGRVGAREGREGGVWRVE